MKAEPGFVFVEEQGWWHGSCWDRMGRKRLAEAGSEEPFGGNPIALLPPPEQQGYDEGDEGHEPSVHFVDENQFVTWRKGIGPLDELEAEGFRCRGCNQIIRAGKA